LPKEQCEVFGEGVTARMNNFKSVEFFQNGNRETITFDGLKGHKEEMEHFLNVCLGNEEPLFSWNSLENTSFAALKLMESLKIGRPIAL
jgi:hypothetical protein